MKTILPAATLARAVTGYFAWSSQSAPAAQKPQLDECHRMAGEVKAIHEGGGTIPDDLLGNARGCSVTFGQNWAATGGDWAAGLRAEGAARVR